MLLNLVPYMLLCCVPFQFNAHILSRYNYIDNILKYFFFFLGGGGGGTVYLSVIYVKCCVSERNIGQ